MSAHAVPTVQRIAGLSPGTLESVLHGMQMVFDDHQGTGKRVHMEDVSIAGKTGTAEVGGGKKDHAWFVGFVPADVPRYAFVVVIEHGGSGGAVAAPIAKEFIEAMLDAGLLPRKSG
jgi:cell division protein FtsI/penicillin-binding protein 2